jgi:hypothetical protein
VGQFYFGVQAGRWVRITPALTKRESSITTATGFAILPSEIVMPHEILNEPRSTTSRYFNPPRAIVEIGRKLVTGEFESLQRQIENTEIIVACYHNRIPVLVASQIDGQARLIQIKEECLKEPDGSYAPIEFYAVRTSQADKLE